MSDANNTTEPTQVEAAETPVEEQQAEETLGDPGRRRWPLSAMLVRLLSAVSLRLRPA